MRRQSLVAAVVLALLCGLLLPGTALARTGKVFKVKTAIRHVSVQYLVPAVHLPGKGAAITGTLIHRGVAIKHGRQVKTDLIQNGFVRLYRLGAQGGGWKGVQGVQTVNGHFQFDVDAGGFYLVQFGGTHNRRMCSVLTRVMEDSASLTNLRGDDASVDTSGSLFVTMSLDVAARPGVLTSATPGELALFGSSGSPSFFLLATQMPGRTFANRQFSLFAQTIPANGTYRLGFTVPAEDRDQTMTVEAEFTAGGFTLPKTATTKFVPNDLIP